jgi:tetratricopeptide (TPR) repeat protein
LSPKHISINQLRDQLKHQVLTPEEKLLAQLELVKKSPTADNYINLSLMQYNLKDFDACIASCQQALNLDPQNAIAYNNICSAYNAMRQWEKAAVACRKALEIDPDFERARNNLNWSLSEMKSK